MAESFAAEIESTLSQIKRMQEAHGAAARRRAMYFIWRNPWMVAGGNTYIDAMLELAGFVNAAGARPGYPALTVAEIKALDPSVLLFSTEPWPFRIRDAEAMQSEWPDCPGIIKADGQLFSWYGTMTLAGLRELHRYRSGRSARILRPMIGGGERGLAHEGKVSQPS